LSPSAREPSAKPEFRATFVASYPDPAVRLDPPLPEIAFLGRSNVGKSSLLNALAGTRGLAKVSATPGKTRLMNVFHAGACYLVDLPGYGWAKASKGERAGFRRMLEAYLKRRERLAGVVWLLDIRHSPSDDDFAVQDLLIATGRPALTVLTKGDKLPRGRRLAAARARASELGLDEGEPLVTSSLSGDGIAELREAIRQAAGV
jgi:GTP-binding protein